jgi:hypothetical protein
MTVGVSREPPNSPQAAHSTTHDEQVSIEFYHSRRALIPQSLRSNSPVFDPKLALVYQPNHAAGGPKVNLPRSLRRPTLHTSGSYDFPLEYHRPSSKGRPDGDPLSKL